MNRVFRANVAAIIKVGSKYLCCERREPRGVWQTVQGGVETFDRSTEHALLREMYEELGVSSNQIRVLGRSSYWRRYEFPPELIQKYPERKNVGQEQMWFFVEIPSTECIDLKRSEGEFVRVELVELEQFLAQIVSWKLPIVKDFCYEIGLLDPLAVEKR